jgi:hypothetical protein
MPVNMDCYAEALAVVPAPRPVSRENFDFAIHE